MPDEIFSVLEELLGDEETQAMLDKELDEEQTQLKFSPCFFSDYRLPFAAKTEVQSIPKGANRFNLLLGRAKRA